MSVLCCSAMVITSHLAFWLVAVVFDDVLNLVFPAGVHAVDDPDRAAPQGQPAHLPPAQLHRPPPNQGLHLPLNADLPPETSTVRNPKPQPQNPNPAAITRWLGIGAISYVHGFKYRNFYCPTRGGPPSRDRCFKTYTLVLKRVLER